MVNRTISIPVMSRLSQFQSSGRTHLLDCTLFLEVPIALVSVTIATKFEIE